MTLDAKARAIATKINKKHGAGTIVLGSEIDHSLIPRVTSGSLGIDVALGGGWPANQWNEIMGDPSHGKTALVLKTIAANQAIDPKWTCAWVAAEEFVREYATKLGCDVSRMMIVDTNIMEIAYDTVIEYLDSRAVDAVVIDSLPALQPASEDDGAMADFQVGLGARLTNKFFRKQGKATKRSLITEERPVTGFMINQFREKIGVMYGDPRTTPGGKGKDFAYFTRVEVRRDEWIEDDQKRRVGQTIKVRTTKNKSAPPQRVATVDFYFADMPPFRAGDFDRIKEVMNLSVLFEIVQAGGGGMYSYRGDKWKGRPALLTALREEPELLEQISGEVMDAATLPADTKQTEPTPAPAKKKVVRKKRA